MAVELDGKQKAMIASVNLVPGANTNFGAVIETSRAKVDDPTSFQSMVVEDANHYDDTWRWKPVNVLAFFKDYLNKKLSKKQIELALALCGEDPFDLMPPVQEATAIWGMRSGKNYLTEGIFIFKAYQLECLIDPHGYFGLTPDRTIDLINLTVVNENQARAVFFHNASNTLRNCRDPETGLNWFKSKLGMDIRPGKDIKKKEMDLPRNIRLCSFNTEADAFQGFNVYFWVADEVSRANTKVRYDKAKAQFQTVIANNKATFKEYASGVLITYPDNDTIDYGWERYKLNLKKLEENPEARIWADCSPTYEVRDDLTEADVRIMIEEIGEEFGEVAYLCKVRKPEQGFFKIHPERIGEMFDENLEPAVQYGYGITERRIKEDGKVVKISRYTSIHFTEVKADRLEKVDPYDTGLRMRHANDLTRHFQILTGENRDIEMKIFLDQNRNDMRGDYNSKGEFMGEGKGNYEKLLGDNKIRFLSGDPGLTGDAYVLAGGYCQRVDQENSVLAESAAKNKIFSMPVIDIIIRIKPQKGSDGKKIPVDFINVQNIISTLKVIYPNLKKVSFDHWQSELQKQELEAQGLQTDINFFSNKVQYRLYVNLRRIIYSGLMRCIKNDLLKKELEQALDINGNKIDHPPQGSKDIGDALAMVTKLIVDTDLDASGFDMI